MRRAELIAGAEQVVRALRASDVEAPLVEVARLGNRPGPLPAELLSRVLAALREYAVQASRFTRPGREVAAALGVAELERSDAWSRVVGSERRGEEAFAFVERIRFALHPLPALMSLLDRGPRERIERAAGAAAEADVLTVQVIESPRRYSTPARLAMLLQSVETIYDALAVLERAEPGSLSVVGCDAGVDKTFELLGEARVIARMREVILSLWDRVVFHRDAPAVERYKLASASLPALERVRVAAAAGELTPEEAELVRRRLIDGTGRFLVAGATIPELQERAYANPRTLMAPAPKLIGPAVTGGE